MTATITSLLISGAVWAVGAIALFAMAKTMEAAFDRFDRWSRRNCEVIDG